MFILAPLLAIAGLVSAAPNPRQLNPDYVIATPGPKAPANFGPPPAPSKTAYTQYLNPRLPCVLARVRKEWRTLSTAQQQLWVNSVKCLAKLPHVNTVQVLGKSAGAPPLNTQSSVWDDLSFVHMDQASEVHLTGFFLTWHRQYVDNFDQLMRTKCGYSGPTPYWDWSKDAPNFYDGSIFKGILGSWGNPNQDSEVTTGGFANFSLAYPYRHNLRRQFTPQPFNFPFFPAEFQKEIANSTFTADEINNKVVKGFTGQFKFFQGYFERLWGAHGSVHGILGGDLGGVCSSKAPSGVCTSNQFSPNEPLFMLHHANVDRVWWAWQNANKAQNFWAFEGGSVVSPDLFSPNNTNPNGIAPWLNLTSRLPTDNFLAEGRIADIMDTMGGYLCYTYDSAHFG